MYIIKESEMTYFQCRLFLMAPENKFYSMSLKNISKLKKYKQVKLIKKYLRIIFLP